MYSGATAPEAIVTVSGKLVCLLPYLQPASGDGAGKPANGSTQILGIGFIVSHSIVTQDHILTLKHQRQQGNAEIRDRGNRSVFILNKIFGGNLSVFGGTVPTDRDERQELLDRLDCDGVLDECDDAFYNYEDDLEDLNYIYVMAHRSAFD